MSKKPKPTTALKDLKRRIERSERLHSQMQKSVSPERRKEVKAEVSALHAWWFKPIGVGQGTRDATIRDRLMLYHVRYCLRTYPLWDVLAFWAKSQQGPNPDTAVGDLCRWLDWELERLDRNKSFGEANVAATVMVVLTLMREHFRANAAPSLPPWDEQTERAEMLIARATRAKMDAEARANGEDAPYEHPAIARLFDAKHECPPAFFVEPSPLRRKAVRRGTA